MVKEILCYDKHSCVKCVAIHDSDYDTYTLFPVVTGNYRCAKKTSFDRVLRKNISIALYHGVDEFSDRTAEIKCN